MKHLFHQFIAICIVSIATLYNFGGAKAQTLSLAQDSLAGQNTGEQWTADVEYANKLRWTLGTGADVSYLMQSIKPERFFQLSSNLLGIRSTDKINGIGANYTLLLLDIPSAENIITVIKLGLNSERVWYQNIDKISLRAANMPNTLRTVEFEQSFAASINSIMVGVSFRRRIISSLFTELGIISAFIFSSNINYSERIDNFFYQDFDDAIPQTHPYFQAFGGISYIFPLNDTGTNHIFTLSPYIRYYYPLTSLTSIVDWRTSRLCVGLEIRL